MEEAPEDGQELELPDFVEITVEQVDSSNAVETIGRTQQDRLSEIMHARQYRRELIDVACKEIEEIMIAKNKNILGFKSLKTRFSVTERRRQNYVHNYEDMAQAEIQELLGQLNLDNPEHQAILIQKLNQEYNDLKIRLVIVEMETRRLIQIIYEQATGLGLSDPNRVDRLYGTSSKRDIDAAELLLFELDSLRAQKLDDTTIYKLLVRKYHPDVSDHEKSEEITKLLSALYDKLNKRLHI